MSSPIFVCLPRAKLRANFFIELSNYAIDRHQKGLTTVLVVDEAHHLSADVLEEIRLLTNLETGEAKLLQILLVGSTGTGREAGFGRSSAAETAHRTAFSP